jgi:type VI secretion system secreted protein VgrG
VSQEVQTGVYVLDDFDFERPKTDLLVKSNVSRQHSHASYEVFDYPGEYVQSADGDGYVKKRIEEQQADYERVRGSADVCGLQVGGLFSLVNYPRGDQNREYLVVSTQQTLLNNEYETGGGGEGASWECRFEAVDGKQPFRSKRHTPKPTIRGPQTAVVVGKQGEEIWTDKYGRVKVQFHWDRYGKSDENSSCWVRVAQLWAGKTWGAIHIPRIGQEVIVEFLEGDPDRPIVTGRVYNADEMPPYELPTNQTQSGLKSRSSTEGTNQNFNELRFEDKKGAEHIYFHAEKDFERIVENNDTLKVGFQKKDAGDQVIQIHNNQMLTIGNRDSKDGSQTIEIWKNLTESLKTGDSELTISKGKRTATIEGDDALTLKTGNAALTISKGKRTTTIEGDDALTIKTGNLNIAIDAGKNQIEAAQSILLKVGGSSIKIEPACITLKSVSIKIHGEASVDLKAPMTKCAGTAQLVLKGGMTMIN